MAPGRKRAKKAQLAKRSRGRSKIEQQLLNQIKGKANPLASSTSSQSDSSSSSSELEAARPTRKRIRQRRASSPLSISDSHSDLARAVSLVSVQVGKYVRSLSLVLSAL